MHNPFRYGSYDSNIIKKGVLLISCYRGYAIDVYSIKGINETSWDVRLDPSLETDLTNEIFWALRLFR